MSTVTKDKAPIRPYMRVAQRLEADIRRGRYVAGDMIPGEHALCEQLGVSRVAVRNGLRVLREKNLIVSRRGVGTLVLAQQSVSKPALARGEYVQELRIGLCHEADSSKRPYWQAMAEAFNAANPLLEITFDEIDRRAITSGNVSCDILEINELCHRTLKARNLLLPCEPRVIAKLRSAGDDWLLDGSESRSTDTFVPVYANIAVMALNPYAFREFGKLREPQYRQDYYDGLARQERDPRRTRQTFSTSLRPWVWFAEALPWWQPASEDRWLIPRERQQEFARYTEHFLGAQACLAKAVLEPGSNIEKVCRLRDGEVGCLETKSSLVDSIVRDGDAVLARPYWLPGAVPADLGGLAIHSSCRNSYQASRFIEFAAGHAGQALWASMGRIPLLHSAFEAFEPPKWLLFDPPEGSVQRIAYHAVEDRGLADFLKHRFSYMVLELVAGQITHEAFLAAVCEG